MTSCTRLLLAALSIASLSTPALAHHGWSSYDATKTITLTAPLTNVAWTNPHGTARVEYRGRHWEVVLAPTGRMEARGLSRDELLNAKSVTLEGYPRLDGTPEMRIERITINGKTIELR